MKLKRLSLLMSLLSTVFMVSSCTNTNVFEAYTPIDPVSDSAEDEVAADGSYIKHGSYDYYYAVNAEGNPVELGTTYEVLKNRSKRNILQAEGKRKILVVPVQFPDFTYSHLGITKDEYIENLNKAFFGKAKNNKYVSVAEYYNRSSYGKLEITGEVCTEFFTFHQSVNYINVKKTEQKEIGEAYTSVVNTWYETTFNKSINEFRVDPNDENSGVAIFMVYTYPSDSTTSGSSFFWAYTLSDKPLAWASYSTLNTFDGNPDAHTLIHEVGHMFGLNDYYPSSEKDTNTSNEPEPTGRIDMMDCSIGDHTAFSKMVYNWTRPYHIKDSCEISISPLINKGDLILINDHWNNTVFDEYFLIELYSPLGLNFQDSNSSNTYAKLPTLPGIKIYHVDARLAYYDNRNAFNGYADEKGTVTPSATTNIAYAHDNNTYTSSAESGEDYKKNYLYELELNTVGYAVAKCATNANLFHKDDTFTINSESFNKTNDTSYKITISKAAYETATLKIEKVTA